MDFSIYLCRVKMTSKHKKRTMKQSAEIEYEKEETIETANGLRSAWYKLRERLEDWYDLLYIWWYRNEPKRSFDEFMEEENKRRGIEHV
ncbi:hypothetical protein Barb4_01868 [Bacteroidales bacterium Barb4]|nr:hypothetical protein Barb4_01868 [Bacteroidales bacterium Barb4]